MNVQEAQARFKGAMVSVATPFTDDQKVDLGALREHIRFMVDRGLVAGKAVLLVAAAGGEFPMLTMEERKAITKASVEAARGQVPVAVSLQFNATQDVVELARYAHEVGADLGQLSPPFYYGAPEGDVVGMFKAASEQSELPLMIYANWWRSGNLGTPLVDKLCALRNVVALKWSAPSFMQLTQGLSMYAKRLAVIDNSVTFVWGHMLGAVGFITHIGNFWPEYPLSIWELLEARQYDQVIAKLEAFQWQWERWIWKVIAQTEGEGPFIKAAMDEVGLRGGPPRLPATPVSPELRAEFHRLCEEAGVPKVQA
jgi:dihydrodipicolinate synthase/N-acetylneuraminate lyase